MISFADARSQILASVLQLGRQEVRLTKLLGSYLAQPVIATGDLPGFDNSAVDGFGVLASDVSPASDGSPVKLRVSGVIQAGDPGNERLVSGTALKILTGAPVPPTADSVVMKEFCEEKNGFVLVKQPIRIGENIRRRGGEYKKGQEVLPKGVRVTPPVIGLLATLGFSSFPVYMKPRLAVVGTGNELVKPGRPLQQGQIYDSNSYALVAAAQDAGVDVCRSFLARDDADSTRNAVTQALRESDVLITAGGVSVGDYDIVKDVLEECGVSGLFWRIAIKPGKPVYFGTLDSKSGSKRKLVFGLPGNPVSALVTFHQLVRPALLKMMGAGSADRFTLTATLKKRIAKKAGRLEFVRGILAIESGQLVVQPAAGQDSHMLGGLSQADCLIYFPLEQELLPEGESVQVELLSWSAS